MDLAGPDHGVHVFVAPENIAPVDYRVRFAPPPGWALLCPWEEPEPGVFAPAGLSALREDLIALGDWRVSETVRVGCRVMLAVAPGQARVETMAVPIVAEIVEAEIGLFGMLPRPRYLFLFHPGRRDFFGGSPSRPR